MFIVEKDKNDFYHWSLRDGDDSVVARCINEGYPTKAGCKSSMQKVRDAIVYGDVTIKDLT